MTTSAGGHTATSRLGHSPDASDRRTFQRYHGQGLVASVAKRLAEIDDISVGGVRFERHPDLALGETVAFQLIPRHGRNLLLNDALSVVGTVVGADDKWTRIQFQAVKYTLAKMIVRHIAHLSGTKPFLVK
ncbi:MAG: PilZ domain-containing protein [Magnetospirillum sp.]|nr:PilZ domain-containing protein [Magnetospirillum sp.]